MFTFTIEPRADPEAVRLARQRQQEEHARKALEMQKVGGIAWQPL